MGTAALVLGVAAGLPAGHAGPQGGQVVGGSGSITTPDAATTVVQQNSARMAIDWRSFDVAAGERVRFQQPSASAAVLNRVFNQLPSQIYGSIEANGQVFIMNPRGVVFGPGAVVDVGALFASSLDIGVDDFMQGRYTFSAPIDSEPGLVVNRGLIHAATGHVALLGGAVENHGTVVADLGNVVLGAGRRAAIDFDGDGMIRFQLEGELLSNVAGGAGAVVNAGEITSGGGQVRLEAAVAKAVFDHAINNEGVIRAARIDRDGGRVTLAGAGAEVRNAGLIDASGEAAGGEVTLGADVGVTQAGTVRADGGDAGGRVRIESDGLTVLGADSSTSATAGAGTGGSVLVLGDSVALLGGAVVDASGDLGGGSVLVGGDYQGANPAVRNATRTGVAPGARIVADARARGDGGTVIVWSEGATNFYGDISARGGAAGGDGGFAEVSGRESLAYRGHADLGAPNGERGTLLLDPLLIIIRGGSGDSAGDGGDMLGATPGEILFSDLGPTIIYESEIELQSRSADINLRATNAILVDFAEFDHASGNPGDSASGTLALARDASLVVETRNNGPNEAGFIDLTSSVHGADLEIVTSGAGTITVASAAGGDRSAPILVPSLTSESDIVIDAGGAASAVFIRGVIKGANIDIDASGSLAVLAGARVLGGGDGTALTIDAGAISVENATAAAPAITNSGTGTVALSAGGAANIVLGRHALATDVGALSLVAGGSILAANASDPSGAGTEIHAGGVLSLSAGDDIGTRNARIEFSGATDLVLDLAGNLHVAGSDGAGGAGASLRSLALSLEPDDDHSYVLENFAEQSFVFSADDASDAFVIEELVSAVAMDLSITTREEGMLIGNGGAGGGIHLAGASDVMLDSARGIGERRADEGGLLEVEVSTDGVLTLVARDSVGADGAPLELASAGGGEIGLEATLVDGSLNVRALERLAIVGSGVSAPDGGELAGARLEVRADVAAGDDLALRAAADALAPGNDLRITEGARVTLEGGNRATLTLAAGDHVELAAGAVSTTGSSAHRIVVAADGESGGADGVIGAVTQSGEAFSLSAPNIDLRAGGGIGESRALVLETGALSVDNTTAGDVRIANRGDLVLAEVARNGAAGGLLAVTTADGHLDTGDVAVITDGGAVLLEARDTALDGSSDLLAHVRIGAGGIATAGGAVDVLAAEDVHVAGTIDSGGGGVNVRAGHAAGEAVADDVGELRLAADLLAGDGEVALGASGDIVQLAGAIDAARLAVAAGGMVTLTGADNAFARVAGTADGDVTLANGGELTLESLDTGSGKLWIDNAEGVRVAGNVVAGDGIRIATAAGDIDGAGGRLASTQLTLDAAGGIGRAAPLGTAVSGELDLLSRGADEAGDIRLLQEGMLAASQFVRLSTPADSGQTIAVGATGVLVLDADPIVTPHIQGEDRVELAGSRIDLAFPTLSGQDTDVRFRSPVGTSAPEVRILLGDGIAMFDGNVSPGAGTTLRLESDAVFASGRVTGEPGSTLVVARDLDLVVDTTLQVDNLVFVDASPDLNEKRLTGPGGLTLLPATHGSNVTIGAMDGIASKGTLDFLSKYGVGRNLSIGVPLRPSSTSPYAGNVRIVDGIDVGDATLTVGGLGDVIFDNHDSPLRSSRAVNVVAIGDRSVFPGLVAHRGGDIVDVDASPGAPSVVDAPVVRLVAQGRVGLAGNAFDVGVGGAGRVEFVTGASNAFVNTVPGGRTVENVARSSPILADFRALGFFSGTLNVAALGRPVGLETTGLETTGLGELGFVDEGLFLLPEPFTTPVQATLLPALMDPDFPADRRPLDPEAEGEWQSFYSGALRDYVEARYPAPAEATDGERDAIRARVENEWQALVQYFEWVRARERGTLARAPRGLGGS